MSKLDIKCLDEGYSFVDICGLPLYRGSGLKLLEIRPKQSLGRLPLYRGSGLKYAVRQLILGVNGVFLCIEEVD